MIGRFSALAAMAMTVAAPAAAQALVEHPARTVIGGVAMDHSEGTLVVPARRDRRTGERFSIPFRRFRAAQPSGAPPVFLLAGGPGDSWIDRLATPRGAAEVRFLSEFADVVLFDQRGAGHARPRPTCRDEIRLPLDRAPAEAERIAAMRRLAVACRDDWRARGVDLSAYTTPENADDVDALRAALGYRRISLVAGSYGSHLAISYMRRHPGRVARAMLRGLEGPDHTWDMPSGVLAALGRVAAAAEADPALAADIPPGGLVAALRAVEERLAKTPQTVRVGDARVVVGADDLRAAATFGARRDGRWPAFVIDLYRGNYARLGELALARRTVRLSDPMYYVMDCASGISPARARTVANDPAAAVLGDVNLDYTALCDIWGAPDLGAGFRSDLVTDIPVLMFHGSWDTSTPIENAREVARGMRRITYAEVDGATHPTFDELYENWSPMRGVVRSFLTGGTPAVPTRIALPPVRFAQPTAPR